MSYSKEISNHIIIFKDEKDYLEARLEYLNLYSDIPFLGFIQEEMYDKEKCEVEDISSSPISTITWAYDGSSNTPAVGADVIVNGYTASNDIATGDYSYAVGSDGLSTIWTYYNSEGEYGDILTEGIPVKKKKKEEPEDPIKNRFEILDL
jgi:hypothetical protein